MTAQGIARPLLQDLYHRLIAGSWGLLFGLFSAVYLGVNLAFAAGYTACGPDAVANLPGRGILHRFFFSVETISTIGYGVMAPNSACALSPSTALSWGLARTRVSLSARRRLTTAPGRPTSATFEAV